MPASTRPSRLHPPESIRPARRAFTTSAEFSRLISPEIPGMLRAARAILGSDDLAWDAVQETLLRVWRLGWPEKESGAALRRLVRLSALHGARCRRRRRYHEDRASSVEPCCDDDPLADMDSAETNQILLERLARITACYRVVFELYELQGWDYRRIAAALAVPVGTVRSRLSRARRELRGKLR